MNKVESGRKGGLSGGHTTKQKWLKVKKEYEENPKRCLYCKKPFPYTKRRSKFCNCSCAASFNNIGIRRHGKKPSDCLYCGKKLSEYSKRFCCREHHRLYEYEEYVREWLVGIKSGLQEKGINNCLSIYVKKWIKERSGNKCEKCGWAEINMATKKVPLQYHHKDGDSKNCRPDNIEHICPNCHSLTETYGSLNKGNGRKLRHARIV